MSTKAVHLEAVSDLSSATFLAALKRLVARRGLPSDVYSDNGKNFKGVANYLKQLFQIIRSETIQNFATSHFIHWHFIPPYSPHFGGQPLTPLSSDPSDVRALTPGHFIIGVPLLEIPERENSSNLTLSSGWILIQQIKQEFWKRWSKNYLHHLQNRPKWITPRADLKIGDLVVIQDPQAPPLQWKLGRINCTHPGPDLRVRVVSIRTQ
ncbi:integrase catalytic domain-containing protein [Trichonephila clavipes]|nr:integrase catalytic domain-containing protein [Trichonephila clavipes]